MVRDKGAATKDDRKEPQKMESPSVVIRKYVRPFIEKIAFAARELEHFTEVDFEEILGYGERTPKIQAPMPPVSKNAPAQSAVRHVVDAAEITEHLRRRDPVLRFLAGIGTVERPIPALCFDHADPMLEPLPSAHWHQIFFFGFSNWEQECVGHIIAPLCRKVLLDQHIAPAERFEERPDQLLLGLGLGRCLELAEAGKKRVEPVSQTIQRCIVEPLPGDFVPDPFD